MPIAEGKISGEMMVRYCGWYGNVTRGKRQKRAEEDAIPGIIESAGHGPHIGKSGPG